MSTSPEADAACAIDVSDDDMNTPVRDPVVSDAVAGFQFSTAHLHFFRNCCCLKCMHDLPWRLLTGAAAYSKTSRDDCVNTLG
jgi:hypothetical protein